jgi:hypothetical protein
MFTHSAQGLTAERVLIHADTGVHPDLLRGIACVGNAHRHAALHLRG